MSTLFRLFARSGGVLTFVVVELVCFYIIVQYNQKQGDIYVHSLGRWTTRVMEREQRALDYFSLREQADSLHRDNARLMAQWFNARDVQLPGRDTVRGDSAVRPSTILFDSLVTNDSLRNRMVRPAYEVIPARAVGNSVHNTNNWVIINRGSTDQVRPNSGVITTDGLVGIVYHVDPEFSLVMSLLHRQTKISAALKNQQALASLVWEGGDPGVMSLKFIPKHVKVQAGDPVVTSGYSDMFPRGLPIGMVEGEVTGDPENPYYLVARVRLSQDLARTDQVYVVNNIFSEALENLRARINDER
jgi:rod shape-determining protein MreC